MARIFLVAALGTIGGSAAAADYVSIRKEILVDRPADAVWSRVGDYCAIGEWMKIDCELVSGSGDVGSVRRLAGRIVEPMVARTERSYTYSQIAGSMAGKDYHGTLAVEPAGAERAKIVYTLVYDASLLSSDEDRAAQYKATGDLFQKAIETMKALAEKDE